MYVRGGRNTANGANHGSLYLGDQATNGINIGEAANTSQTIQMFSGGTIGIRAGTASSLFLGSGVTNYWRVTGSTGHFEAVTDNANDIGSAGANRPRRIYAGTEVVVGNTITVGSNSITASAGNNMNLVVPTNQQILLNASAAASGVTINANGSGGYFVLNVGDGGFDVSSDSSSTLLFNDGVTISQTAVGGLFQIQNTGGELRVLASTANINASGTGAVTIGNGTGTVTINGVEDLTGKTVATLRIRANTGQTLDLGANNTAFWRIQSAGHLVAITDNTVDIGASSATRPRSVYAGTSVVVAEGGGSGSVTVSTGAIAGSAGLTLSSGGASDVTVNSAASINLNAAANEGIALDASAAGSISLTADSVSIYGGGSVSMGSSASVSIYNDTAGDISISNFVAAGHVDIQSAAGGSIKLNSSSSGAVTIGNGTGTVTINGLEDLTGKTTATFRLRANAGQVMELGANNTAFWRIESAGHLVAITDNTVDIGASGATRPRTVYAGTSVVAPAVDAGAGLSLGASTATSLTVGRSGITTTVNGSADLTGSVGLGAIATVSADTTLDATHAIVLVDASAAPVTITLPAAAGATRRHYTVKKIDSSSNAVTIDGDGAETIDGSTTQSLVVQYEALEIACNGTAWFVL